MTKAWMVVLLALVAPAAAAQAPSYEAASIKPNTSGSGSSSTNGSKGQIRFTNVTLRRLIENAYRVKPMQVVGPAWLEDVRFDIVAKYPEETKPEDRAVMLRSLLQDRFKLATHPETHEFSGYALIQGRGGFKLKPIQTSDNNTSSNGNGKTIKLTVKGVSMPQFADYLTRHLNEYVVDRTGVEGVYEFEMEWSTDDRNAAVTEDPRPTIFTALQEKLGLKLQAQKVPVEMVVVDHVERAPTEN